MIHHLTKWGGLHEKNKKKTLSLQLFCSLEAVGCHGANVEIKFKLLMRHNDWNETVVTAKCPSCFCIDLMSGKTRWAFLIIYKRGTEKNSLFIIRVRYWLMTSHPQVPITGPFTWLCSPQELIYSSYSASCSCHLIFCCNLSCTLDQWRVDCCNTQWNCHYILLMC